MGPDGAVNIIYRDELLKAEDPDAVRAAYTAQYRATFANPYKAAELGFVDEVILPRHTRARLIAALRMLKNKRQDNLPRKHGNIPL